MTQKEQTRLRVLNGVLVGAMGMAEAAQVLRLSERHVWRILAAYRKDGAAALAHGNRGRRPVNAVPEKVRRRVVELARTRYAGLNHTHLSELLAENEGLALDRSTVSRILTCAGLESPRQRRPPRHRVRRERMSQEGMLVQIDGSHHDWLEGRGPWLTLLLAVDDATGTVPWALFREQEDTVGYWLLVEGIIARRAIPLALYSDRHAVFRHAGRGRVVLEGPHGDHQAPTQFGRAMQELGISQIFARSPEAKGRVERLAGTFQDRLVGELRLAAAGSLAEANQVLWGFLPRFNARFGVPAAEPGWAYRPVPPDVDLASVLCFKETRKVARDNTVKYRGRTLQLLPGAERPSYAGARIQVQERLDGRLVVCHQGRVLSTREAPPRPLSPWMSNGLGPEEPPTTPFWLAAGVRPEDIGTQRRKGAATCSAPREGAAAACSTEACWSTSSLPGAPDISLAPAPQPRRPTTRQQTRWDAVQAAKRQGLSLRAIAREFGISRNTVAKYAKATRPPTYPPRAATPSVATNREGPADTIEVAAARTSALTKSLRR